MAGEPARNDRLAEMNDEDLVLLAQRDPALQQAAAGVPTIRYREKLGPLVTRYTRCLGLTVEDKEDADQEIYFWTLAAIPLYEPARIPKSSRFRTFLGRVILSRLFNYAEHIRLHQCKYKRPIRLTKIADGAAPGMPGLRNRLNDADTDPATIVGKRESLTLLAEALGQMDVRKRWVCHQVAEDSSVRELADTMGVNVGKAKRARRQALQDLKARLTKITD